MDSVCTVMVGNVALRAEVVEEATGTTGRPDWSAMDVNKQGGGWGWGSKKVVRANIACGIRLQTCACVCVQ